ncbi:hypothetical protein CGLO_13028 [Colletotrichum gloeosporioides Cg-14]|uniref:Uncharacterized protein n=1 Tax=Colletotrichum gloeosporioides (strain Cg-14) TaxID=1237896 RepID=T0LHZ7_COLGC|nr:hypothetical protein CGLO_13028 [Colletotrichum gloeosporioides Cg-14]
MQGFGSILNLIPFITGFAIVPIQR